MKFENVKELVDRLKRSRMPLDTWSTEFDEGEQWGYFMALDHIQAEIEKKLKAEVKCKSNKSENSSED